jgi:hypothetical protein
MENVQPIVGVQPIKKAGKTYQVGEVVKYNLSSGRQICAEEMFI